MSKTYISVARRQSMMAIKQSTILILMALMALVVLAWLTVACSQRVDESPKSNSRPQFSPAAQLDDKASVISSDNVRQIRSLDRLGNGKAIEAAYDPTGRTVALLTTIGVFFYDAHTFEPLRFLEVPEPAHSLRFSPDGSLVGVVLAQQNSVQLWHTDSGELHHTLRGTDATITQIEFVSGGELLAVASHEEVTIWQAREGKKIRTLESAGKQIWADMAFTSVGNYIAAPVVADTTDTILLWRVADGALQQTLSADSGTWLDAGHFSPDGRLFAAVNSAQAWGGTVKIVVWRATDGHLLYTLQEASNISEDSWAFSPDSRFLAAGLENGDVALWRLADGVQLNRLTAQSSSAVTHLAFTPEGQQLVVGHRDGRIDVWSISTSSIQRSVDGQIGNLSRLVLAPDGDHLLTVSSGGVVQFWRLSEPEPVHSMATHAQTAINSVAFRPIGDTIAAGTSGGQVNLWTMTSGTIATTFEEKPAKIDGVAFSPDGRLLATGFGERINTTTYDDTVQLWRVADHTLLHEMGGEKEDIVGCSIFRNSVDFSADGSLLAAGSHDFTVKVWRVSDGSLQHSLTGNLAPILDVAFSPEGSLIASAAEDGTVQLWHLPEQTPRLTLTTGIFGAVADVSFAPDGKTIASGEFNGAIHLWDIATGQLLLTFDGHKNSMADMAFSPDGTLLAAGANANDVQIWSVADGTLVHTLSGHSGQVQSVAFSFDGQRLVSGAMDGTLRIWGLP